MGPQTESCADEDDHHLVMQMANGERDAFDRLYRRYNPSFLAIMRSKCGQEADDICNNTWLKCRLKPPLDNNPEKKTWLKAWLLKVAKNEWIDRCRSKKPLALPENSANEIEGREIDLDREDVERRMNNLADCLKILNDEFQEPLKMWMQGHSHSEIGEQFEISVTNSEKRVYRGKLIVKDCMQRKGWTE